MVRFAGSLSLLISAIASPVSGVEATSEVCSCTDGPAKVTPKDVP